MSLNTFINPYIYKESEYLRSNTCVAPFGLDFVLGAPTRVSLGLCISTHIIYFVVTLKPSATLCLYLFRSCTRLGSHRPQIGIIFITIILLHLSARLLTACKRSSILLVSGHLPAPL